ncbi:hypothetical protein B0H11DRAFT_1744985, partial [Mycena galericulata]
FPEHLAHLCAFRALRHCIAVCRHTTGYLFRNINPRGQITRRDKHITSSNSKYLKILRESLKAVHIDPTLFGTHLLRRGGVQYHYERGCAITHICLLGGWSTDFSASSIWRYLAALVDEEGFDRLNFLNPFYNPKPKCWQCGADRSSWRTQ